MFKEGTPTERSAAAWQIRRVKSELERIRIPQRGDNWDRDIIDYIDALGGITSFLNYAEGLGNQQTILDIGSGSFRGITQISRIKAAENLNFVGTTLSRTEDIEKDTGSVKVRITSAEILRGIENESINGILAVSSIAYSKAPSLVASNIDRVLVPGGVLKSAFRPTSGENEFSIRYDYKTHHRFSEAFERMGYDVAVKKDKDGKKADEAVIIAVKPGGNPKPYNPHGDIYTAEDLVRIDSPLLNIIMYNQGQL